MSAKIADDTQNPGKPLGEGEKSKMPVPVAQLEKWGAGKKVGPLRLENTVNTPEHSVNALAIGARRSL